jgi:hypothetical protein
MRVDLTFRDASARLALLPLSRSALGFLLLLVAVASVPAQPYSLPFRAAWNTLRRFRGYRALGDSRDVL